MTTAFQSDAFQNNAFQIDSSVDTHDGVDSIRKFHLPIYVGEGHLKQPISNILRIYDRAKELDNTQKLLSIVEPFIEVQTLEELEKRSQAQRIVDKLPDINRININNLARNQMAIDMLLAEISIINQRLNDKKELRERDDMLLILISACI